MLNYSFPYTLISHLKLSELSPIYKNSQLEVLSKKGVQKFRKMHRKKLVLEPFGFQPVILLEKRLRHRCFPVNLAKLLRTPPFFMEHLWWQLVEVCNFTRKEILAQVFSCDFCEMFKNIFFIEHFRWLLLSVITSVVKGCW